MKYSTWPSGRCPCPRQGGWNQRIYKIPSNPNHAMILSTILPDAEDVIWALNCEL